jgi:hypothetical protein
MKRKSIDPKIYQITRSSRNITKNKLSLRRQMAEPMHDVGL